MKLFTKIWSSRNGSLERIQPGTRKPYQYIYNFWIVCIMSSLPMDSKHNPARFVSAHAQSSIHCACGGMPHQQRQPPAQRALPRAYPLHKGRWLQLSHKIVRGGCLATVTKFTASVHSQAWMLVLPWRMAYCGASSDICSKGFKKHFHLQHLWFKHNMYIYALGVHDLIDFHD